MTDLRRAERRAPHLPLLVVLFRIIGLGDQSERGQDRAARIGPLCYVKPKCGIEGETRFGSGNSNKLRVKQLISMDSSKSRYDGTGGGGWIERGSFLLLFISLGLFQRRRFFFLPPQHCFRPRLTIYLNTPRQHTHTGHSNSKTGR